MGVSGINASASNAALTQAQLNIATLAKANAVARDQGDAIVEMLQVATEISEDLNGSAQAELDLEA